MKPASPYGRVVRQRAIAVNRLVVLPFPDEMVRNLRAIYDLATAEEILAGGSWYLRAHMAAFEAAEDHPEAPGIVAALSPQSSWGQNIKDVRMLFQGHADETTQSEINVRKAIAIIGGADPHDVLGGRKVRSFWRNIREPWRPGPVTIDRHAIAAALLGRPAPEYLRLSRIGQAARIGVYQMIAGVYRTCAREVGIMPHQYQAIIWLVWRRINKIAWANHDPF